jgi:GSH-dependent disulfide-bond oxidoreductase
MTERLVLYGARTGNSLRAAIALIEAGVVFEAVKLNLAFGDQHTTGFLRLNPLAKVPVLAAYNDDQLIWALSQSNAIMLKAVAEAPGRLLPVEPIEGAKAIERFFYFVTDVIAPSHAGFYLDQAGFPDGAQAMAALADGRIASSESFLDGNLYMAGDQFSLADISAYTLIHAMRQRLHWRSLPLLADWYARVDERPGVKRGMAAFGA